jgi:tRNA(His) 5'-end guanylyltransferase
MFKDDLGDRLKAYEAVETARVLDNTLPIYARIDGRGFSKFTKGMRRPYDERMSTAMIETTKYLVRETNARLGYTQSDEISLVWLADEENPASEVIFGGKIQKLVSVTAAMATAAFTREVSTSTDPDFAAYVDRLPHFDTRVFQLPNEEEAANAFIWRENDARRNAVSMAARSMFSHNALMNKSVHKMLEMMREAGTDFDTYPSFFRQGTYIRRETTIRTLDEAEVLHIPESKRPDLTIPVTRSAVKAVDTIPLALRNDRVAFVFNREDSPELPANLFLRESRGTLANEAKTD